MYNSYENKITAVTVMLFSYEMFLKNIAGNFFTVKYAHLKGNITFTSCIDYVKTEAFDVLPLMTTFASVYKND